MFVIGTAGHVDHGKSTLVRALTGIDPDRLAEEKAREMTIDLGFAWLKLPGGLEVSVIDVPGHEHFIKNMLVGVSGIDLALLVVAANESVKRQTREHVDILDLMEVPQAIIVITQADLADPDLIALVSMETEDLIKHTRFAGSPLVVVSAVTGQGLPELKSAIEKSLNSAQPRRDIGRPRLPVDRVFTISGSGTVITGTLVDGCLTTGQEVEILPSNLKSRVRGLQTHKASLNTVGPGNRVAVNLVGLSPADVERGDVLTTPGWLTPSRMLDARLRLLEHLERPLKHDTEISLHTGSAEVAARVRLLEKEVVQPGETTWVQFLLDKPLAVVNGDHYVIRSPMTTLGGGIIVEAHPARHRRFRPDVIENLKDRGEGKAEEALLAILQTKQPQEIDKLIAQSNLAAETAREAIESLIAQGRVVAVGDGSSRVLFSGSAWKQMVDNTVAMVQDYHRKFPLRLGIPRAEISSRIKLGTHFQGFLQKLVKDGILAEESAVMRLPGFQIKLTAAQEDKIRTFLRQLSQNPYSPAPDPPLEPDLLNLLADKGEVIKTTSGVVFSAQAFQEMTRKVLEHTALKGKITLGETRDLFQTSRKYAQALLEYMDEKKLTRRVGDDRVPYS